MYVTRKKTWKGNNAMFRCYVAKVLEQVVVKEHTMMTVVSEGKDVKNDNASDNVVR